ncbi:MAG: LysM peptidoglycan-binding domain-containing protein [Spirochaetaceae bacterium]|nr:LysM peptidoglycan-binding domain-containing protein [Spirochaetaceae bacterium]
MGKKIGIKLADGTFYPIMEDGVPQKKLMELTTVQDNQTTASIDLYRSESGTMEDAEYVDTLELSELAPHPGGETNITFTLKLDENNMLDAEVVEPETGKMSATKSNLVKLPAERKLSIADDVSVADASDIDFEEPPLPELPTNGSEDNPEKEFAQDDFSQPVVEGGTGIADFELPDFDLDDFSSVDSLPSVLAQKDSSSEDSFSTFEDTSPEETVAISESPATIDDLPDFGDVSLDLTDNSSEVVPAFDLDSLDLDDFASVYSGMDDASEDDSNTLLAAGVGAAALGLGAAAIVAADNDQDDAGDSQLDSLLGKDETVADSGLEATSFDLPDFENTSLTGEDTAADSGLEATSFDLPDFDETSVVGDDTVADSGLDATSFDLPDFEDTSLTGEDTVADSGLEASTFDLPDFDETSVVGEDTAADSGLDATSFDLPDFENTSLTGENTAADSGLEATSFDLPDFEDTSLTGEDTAADSGLEATSFDLPDFEDTSMVGEDTVADSGLEASSFDLPDFDEASLTGEDTAADSSLEATSFDLPDFGFGNDDGFMRQDTAVYEDSLPDFSKFELPDFDEPVRNDFSFGEESGLFNENDFNDPAFYTTDTAASAASPLDFSGLYDERETELKQQESRRRRGGLSVAICVICALICVGILLFILFLLPTKLAGGRINDNQVSVTDSHTVTVSQQEMEAVPDSTAAVEDVIVIVETPAVVPAPPPQATRASEVVRYQVKWGDTLWDIAQSYYNNPWLYKRIATANNIKNPDHIVAGTILTIPPQ